jgi:hypothetical protein
LKLSECVGSADINVLRNIAKYHRFSCSLYSKHALIQEILFTFRSPNFLNEQIDKWHLRWPTIYTRLCLSNRLEFSVEEIQAMFRNDRQKDQGLKEAMEQGFIFQTTSEFGRSCYVVPSEFLNTMRVRLITSLKEQVDVSVDGPLTYKDEGFAMCRDLDVFLEYVIHHDVQLTTDGAIYKRHLQQILQLIEIEEMPIQNGWRFGYGRRIHDYPDRFALLYDFSYHAGLIQETEAGMLEILPEVEKWNCQSQEQKQKKLIQFYMSVYRRPIPRLHEIMRATLHLAENWVETNSALDAIRGLVNKFYYDEIEDVWRVRIVKMMMHLGLLKVGTDESEKTWFQIAKLGQQLLTNEMISKPGEEAGGERRILMVQPNFDILVTAEDPMITTEISKFAILKDAGAIRIYRITEKSVQGGLSIGHSLADWLLFVGKFAQGPIPGNVERTLKDWEKTFPSVWDSMTS